MVVLVGFTAYLHMQLFHQNKCSNPAHGAEVLPDKCRQSKPQIFLTHARMIMDLPELVPSTGAGLERRVDALKTNGSCISCWDQVSELDENPEVNEIPIIPKLMKAEGTLHEHCNLS